jgi:nucleotide-binding universal stress UspA family protein
MDISMPTHAVILGIHAPSTKADRPGRSRLSKRVAALVSAAHEREIDAEGRLLAGDPARTILRAASSTCAGAIIMGYDQWRESAPNGSIPGHVVLHATKPVLLVGAPLRRRRPATPIGGD